VRCRIITVDTIDELVTFARKSLYSTILVCSLAECKEVDDALYLNHLEGRVSILTCQSGRHSLLKSLDLHLDKGYELTPYHVKSITFIGEQAYL
jgi:hypothetical protein